MATDKTFFDPSDDDKQFVGIDEAIEQIEGDEQQILARLMVSYIRMLKNPQQYYEMYVNTNYISDTSDPDYEVPPTYEQYRDLTKARVMSYLDGDWGYRLIEDDKLTEADAWRAEHPNEE